MLYDGEQYPLYETCPKCGGTGRMASEDSDPYNREPIGVTFACLTCMGAGRAPSRHVVIERCGSCGGRGHFIDADILEGWPGEDPKIDCEACMTDGYAVRYLTRWEKIVGALRFAWPPDIENPRHAPRKEPA